MKKRLFVAVLLGCFATFSLSLILAGCDRTSATVKLKGNPTTGYTWICEISPEGVVAERSNEYVSNLNLFGASGVGGTFVFTFEAVAAGEADITFSYLRVWEDNPPIDVVVYRATVDARGNLTLVEVSP